MTPPDKELVGRITERRAANRLYAVTLDYLGKCAGTGSAQWVEESERMSILTTALLAIQTDDEKVVEAVLGSKLVPMATAISNGVKLDHKFFMHGLDVLASNAGYRDFADFQSRSKKIGRRQLWWKMNGGCFLICIGAGC